MRQSANLDKFIGNGLFVIAFVLAVYMTVISL